MRTPPSITIVVPYFGPWPAWTPFFLLSCAANPSVNWLLVGDQLPLKTPPNVRCQPIAFQAYVQQISQVLGICFAPKNAYKLCDIKPALGAIHEEELKASDWWGFGDNDVIYGNVRRFLTPPMLHRQTLIACHDTQVSGHLTLIRNIRLMNNAFRHASGWEKALEQPDFCGFDEHAFTSAVYGHKRLPAWLRQIERLLDPVKRHCLFTEQYSTPLWPRPWWNGRTDHPKEWCWKNGRLTNGQDDDREFMYLHFMNFKSNLYLPTNHGPAAWQGRSDLVRITPESAERNGFGITPVGFEPLSNIRTA